jgi:cysteine-rich repeat protein
MKTRAFGSLLLVGSVITLACGGADDGGVPAATRGGSGGSSGRPATAGSAGIAGAAGSAATGGSATNGTNGGAAGAKAGAAGSTTSGGSAGAGAFAGQNAGGASGSGLGGAAGAGAGGKAGAPATSCQTAAECDDKESCTTDTCSVGVCAHVPAATGTPCPSGFCKAGLCVPPSCGDGTLNGGEECDDGNTDDTDACSNTCKKAICGDGKVQGTEKCDDANTNDFDGCLTDCTKPGADGVPFDPNGDGSTGVTLDPNGNVILDPSKGVSKKVKPLIWVANSGEGTVSKVSTQTLTELGRYCTAPGCASDPSRSTVGLSADVVVANRAYSGIPSAVRIASDEASCVDRNGNGVIDTSTGGVAIPWPAGQTTSPDECVLWWQDFSPYGAALPRAAGFDAEIGLNGELSVYVYIGLYSNQKVLRLDGKTGAVVKEIDVPGNPYGLVIDKNGSVWVQGGASLIRIDVKNGDAVTAFPGQCMYGIAADPQGRIYTSGGGCVGRFDPATQQWETLSVPGLSSGGIAIDQNNHAWTGLSPAFEIDASGPTMVKVGQADVGGWGVAIDYDNKPWVIPAFDGGGRAHRLDLSAGPGNTYGHATATVGGGNYTYSDMTGFQLVNAASKAGIFRRTFLGCGAATQWTTLDFSLTAPPSTVSEVSVRVAPDQPSLATATWQKVATLPPDTSPIALNVPVGNVIQVEVTMQSKDLAITPILSGIEVTAKGCGKD